MRHAFGYERPKACRPREGIKKCRPKATPEAGEEGSILILALFLARGEEVGEDSILDELPLLEPFSFPRVHFVHLFPFPVALLYHR